MLKIKKNKITRGIAWYDIHFPEHNSNVLNIGMDFLHDFQPDYFILGGDQLHMDCISTFNHGKPRLTEGKRIDEDYKGFQHDILNPLEDLLPKRCDKYFMIGNHEYRVDRLIDAEPNFEGLIEPENKLYLDDWKIISFNESLSIGKMNFIHGIYVNKYHSFKHLSVYEDNIFYGHLHSFQVHSKTTPLVNLPKQGVSVPCMCDLNPQYMKNKPSSWNHGFLFWYMFPDGTFSYYVVNIINERVVINGKLYGGV